MTKVLYIEDNEDNIYMLKSRLERKGFEVVIARDGEEGYKMATTISPDIILLDVGLPLLDGYQVAKKLKSDPKYQTLPIIMLTANAMAEDRDRALQAGADEYEPKPVNMENLLKKIEILAKKK